ncbi:MAG: HD domain-containing protein [Alphaproteobacteria bacterium]|nr:HD domain-containing protein [Alphaproteobacteria bacterium]
MTLSLPKAKSILKTMLRETRLKLEATTSADSKTAEEQLKVKKWIYRKSFPHPYMVYQCTQDLKKENELLSKIDTLGLDQKRAFEVMDINAYLHDIGRLREVDFSTGLFLNNEQKKQTNFTHARESYVILKELGEKDPNILLPIKYHDARNFDEAINQDSEFQNLSKPEKEKVLFFSRILTDADKMSNILEVSQKGLLGRLELMDPKYKPEAKISPKVKEAILKGENPNREDETTRADALARFATWTKNLDFEASKTVAKQYMNGIFNHIKAEMTPQNENQAFIKDVSEIYTYLKEPAQRPRIITNKINKTRG